MVGGAAPELEGLRAGRMWGFPEDGVEEFLGKGR
jgi:hypothetical protein